MDKILKVIKYIYNWMALLVCVFIFGGIIFGVGYVAHGVWSAWKTEHNDRFVRAKSAYHGNHFFEAIQELDVYLDAKLLSENDNARLMRALSLMKIKHYERAIADFDVIIEQTQNVFVDDSPAAAYYNRGVCKHNLGRYYDAIDDYNSALKAGGKGHYVTYYMSVLEAGMYNSQILTARGLSKSALGFNDAAQRDYEIAAQEKERENMFAPVLQNRTNSQNHD